MPEPLTFFLILPLSSIFFFFFLQTSHGDMLASQHCPFHECGSLNISYPFWLWSVDATSNHYYCGYPGFNLTCTDDEKTLLNLQGESFYVKNISYTDHTLTLVDAQVSSQTCPRLRQNVTLHPLSLSYSSLDSNLSFYYNCSGLETNVSPIECLSSSTSKSYGVPEGADVAGLGKWYDFCEEKVVVPVAGAGDVRDGFVLDWHQAGWCSQCEAWKGLCGYNPAHDSFVCFGSGGSPSSYSRDEGRRFGIKLAIGFGAVLGSSFLVAGVLIFLNRCRNKKCFGIKTENYRNIEIFLENCGPLSLTRYTYSDIKKITNSFGTKLGQGGFASVFKGKLENGCLVAVKVLKGSKGNGEEFINEVATISRTSHVNIVTLLGFCFEGCHRVLIYEFMPHGSLDKFIHNDSSLKIRTKLGWKTLYQIAVGIARGLEYLHRGCNTRILHFDIKPHNILLNEDFHPKISDFGLAKLCPQKESIISLSCARGTVGYIAPEVFCRNFGGISHKSDVYSYGMMVLDMVGERKNTSIEVDRTSETYFPHWIYKHLDQDEEVGLHEIKDDDEANASSRKMIIVALWCIQTDPSQRPSMGRVVEMLEGSLESLQIPPKPFLSSPTRLPVYSSSSPTS